MFRIFCIDAALCQPGPWTGTVCWSLSRICGKSFNEYMVLPLRKKFARRGPYARQTGAFLVSKLYEMVL
jgi:hypothetical protein